MFYFSDELGQGLPKFFLIIPAQNLNLKVAIAE